MSIILLTFLVVGLYLILIEIAVRVIRPQLFRFHGKWEIYPVCFAFLPTFFLGNVRYRYALFSMHWKTLLLKLRIINAGSKVKRKADVKCNTLIHFSICSEIPG